LEAPCNPNKEIHKVFFSTPRYKNFSLLTAVAKVFSLVIPLKKPLLLPL
jgi:hypothetical protein